MRLLYPAGVQVELRIVLQKSVGLFFTPAIPWAGSDLSLGPSCSASRGMPVPRVLFCLVKSIDLEIVICYTNTIK